MDCALRRMGKPLYGISLRDLLKGAKRVIVDICVVYGAKRVIVDICVVQGAKRDKRNGP